MTGPTWTYHVWDRIPPLQKRPKARGKRQQKGGEYTCTDAISFHIMGLGLHLHHFNGTSSLLGGRVGAFLTGNGGLPPPPPSLPRGGRGEFESLFETPPPLQ